MEIYTGQFSLAETYAENDLVVCSIARYDPPWFTGIKFKDLAPSKELLERYRKGGLSFGLFAKEFLAYLETVDFQPILEAFDELTNEYAGIVLCCYENKTQFCHRHLVANYLNTHYALGITEY